MPTRRACSASSSIGMPAASLHVHPASVSTVVHGLGATTAPDSVSVTFALGRHLDDHDLGVGVDERERGRSTGDVDPCRSLAGFDPAQQQFGVDDLRSWLGHTTSRSSRAEPLAPADPDQRQDSRGEHRRVLDADRRRRIGGHATVHTRVRWRGPARAAGATVVVVARHRRRHGAIGCRRRGRRSREWSLWRRRLPVRSGVRRSLRRAPARPLVPVRRRVSTPGGFSRADPVPNRGGSGSGRRTCDRLPCHRRRSPPRSRPTRIRHPVPRRRSPTACRPTRRRGCPASVASGQQGSPPKAT